jgi:hypothetical protein
LPWNGGAEEAAYGDDTAEHQQEDARAKPGFSLSTKAVFDGDCRDRLSLSCKIISRRNGLLVQLSN